MDTFSRNDTLTFLAKWWEIFYHTYEDEISKDQWIDRVLSGQTSVVECTDTRIACRTFGVDDDVITPLLAFVHDHHWRVDIVAMNRDEVGVCIRPTERSD